jgi:tetratricopeptide (TPR) repeat protein
MPWHLVPTSAIWPDWHPSIGRATLALLFAALAVLALACSGEADGRNKAGVNHMIVGALEEAIVEFDGAIRTDPDMALAYYNRGQANFKLGRFEAAKNDYDKAASLESGSSLFKTKRGDAYLALGQYEQAVQDQNQVVDRDSGFALAYYNRGGAYVELGQRSEAIQDFERAVELDHRLGITNNVSSRCAVYDDLYPKDVAFRDCRDLFSHASRFATVFEARGSENFGNGEYRKAIRDFNQAIRLDSSRQLYNSRALAYQGLGQIEEAFRDFETALGKSGFAPAYHNNAKLLYELGEYQVAAKNYTRAIMLEPDSADSYSGRALAYTHLERDKEAILDTDRAAELGVDRGELEGAIQEIKKLR